MGLPNPSTREEVDARRRPNREVTKDEPRVGTEVVKEIAMVALGTSLIRFE
jgi:hypothetical protein